MAGRKKRYPAIVRGLANMLPDRPYIQLRYFSRFHRFCNLRRPATYNEKLQWLKLNYEVPGQWALVDKFEVKEHVAARIGTEHIIPTLGVYQTADEIDFDRLPDSFVLKCTHDSDGVALVRDKHSLDRDATRAKLAQALDRNYYYTCREPHYRNIRPRIIAEPLLEDATQGQLLDYKFFCFDGEVKALFIASDRAIGQTKFDYFDVAFNWLDIQQPYPNSATPPPKPGCYDQMLHIAEELSRDHPHVRVDLYEVNGHVYFGELTFFHFGGFEPFTPEKWDRIWGDWLNLPTSTARGLTGRANTGLHA